MALSLRSARSTHRDSAHRRRSVPACGRWFHARSPCVTVGDVNSVDWVSVAIVASGLACKASWISKIVGTWRPISRTRFRSSRKTADIRSPVAVASSALTRIGVQELFGLSHAMLHILRRWRYRCCVCCVARASDFLPRHDVPITRQLKCAWQYAGSVPAS